jgi:hypothetical protein
VAGVDVNTMDHVRPMLRHGRLTVGLLKRNGGPFDIGSVVDLGPTAYAGHAPEPSPQLPFQPSFLLGFQ